MTFFNRMKIGIIGIGFVGNAIRVSASDYASVVCIDTNTEKGYSSTYEDLLDCDGVFICVPSPAKQDGSCDSSILESVLKELKDYNGVIISKVTAPPDVYSRLSKEFKNLVYCPEFLTARNAIEDYHNQKWIIVGGSTKAFQHEAARIIRETQPNLNSVSYCSIEEASLIKYIVNSFLATKVVFMNEMMEISTKSGCDWEVIRKCLQLDDRIGPTHTQVPGPDGFKGFGGHCFPKDTTSLVKYAESLNVNLNILKEAVKKNTLLRLT